MSAPVGAGDRSDGVAPFGSEDWAGLGDWLREAAVEEGGLGEADLHLFEMVDDPATVVARVKACHRTMCRRLGTDG